MGSAPSPAHIRVVRVTDDMAEALAEFFQRSWGDGSTAESVCRGRVAAAVSNPGQPGTEPPAVAYLRGSEVLGYLGTIPVSFWNGSVETGGYWLKGFMVLPEHRNGPVGFSLLKEMLRLVDVSGIMTVAPPARRLFSAVGYADCGTLPNYIIPLRPARIARNLDVSAIGLGLPTWVHRVARVTQRLQLASLGGGILGLGLEAWRAARRPDERWTITADGQFPDHHDLDSLWTSARSTFAAAAVRNGAFLRWRYAAHTGSAYECASVREASATGRLAAIAVVRRPREGADPRLRGIRVATLSDILFSTNDPDAGLAALVGAERLARRMEADALLCTVAHPAIEEVVRRRGAAHLPGNVHLMIRDPNRQLGFPTEVASWWATRGDASSDEVF